MSKILLLLIMILNLSSCVTNNVDVRPLNIKIESDNEKLTSIPVLYIIYVSGLSSDLHNSYSKMVVFEEYYSDENGMVKIPKHNINEGINRKFNEELIFVNIKLNDSILKLFNTSYSDKSRYAELLAAFFIELDNECFTLVNDKYNGSFININTYDEETISKMGVLKEDLANALFVGSHSYEKENEYFILNLKKIVK